MTEVDSRPERPAPDPVFRAELREDLGGVARGPAWRPARPALLALVYAGSGLALLVVAILLG
jgi:hypothetical protein